VVAEEVLSDHKLILRIVKEDCLNHAFLAVLGEQRISRQTKHEVLSDGLLRRRVVSLAHKHDVAVQRQFQRVNVPVGLREACNYNVLVLLGLVLREDLEVVENGACSQAAHRESPVPRERHVHV